MALAGELAKYIGGELVKNTGKELATKTATSALSNLAPKIATKAVANVANKSVLNSLVPTATRKLASGIELGTDTIPMFRGQTNTLDKLDYNKGLSPNSNGFFMTPNKSATDSWAGKGVVSVDADPNDIMTLDELRSLKKSAEKYFRDPKYQMELYNTNPTQAEIYDALEAGDSYQELSRLTQKPFIERDGGQGTELGEVVFFPDTKPELTSRYNADLASGKNQWLAPSEYIVASETSVPVGTKMKFDKDLNIKDIEKPSRGRGWYADNETNPHISQVVKQNGLDKYLGEPKVSQSLVELSPIVADENGVAKTFYHGSPSMDITDFDINMAGKNTRSGERAIWFTDDYPTAEEFSYERIPGDTLFADKRGAKGKVYERNLGLENPLDLSNLSDKQIEELYNYADSRMAFDGKENFIRRMKEFRDAGNDQLIKSQLDMKKLSNSEYDGIVAKMYPGENEVREIGVFDPRKIKNVDKPNAKSPTTELSPQQQEFFKDSVVRDKNGELMPMYHGSNNKFSVFDLSKSGKSNTLAQVGFWFTPNEKGAKKFADSIWYGDEPEANVFKTYLNIKNPKVYTGVDNSSEIAKLEKQIDSLKAEQDKALSDMVSSGRMTELYSNKRNDYVKATEKLREVENKIQDLAYGDPYELFKSDIYAMEGKRPHDANVAGIGSGLENSLETTRKFVEKLKSEGYDGIVIKNTSYDSDTLGGKNDQYVVFDPDQIKNVDNLNPTNNPDIRYATGLGRGSSGFDDSIERIGSEGLPATRKDTLPEGWDTLEKYLGGVDKRVENVIGKAKSKITKSDLVQFLDENDYDSEGTFNELWQRVKDAVDDMTMEELNFAGGGSAADIIQMRQRPDMNNIEDVYMGNKGHTGRLDAEYSDRLGISKSTTPMSDKLSQPLEYAQGDYGAGVIGLDTTWSSGEAGVSNVAHERMHAWQDKSRGFDYSDEFKKAFEELEDEIIPLLHNKDEISKYWNGRNTDYYFDRNEQEARMVQDYLEYKNHTKRYMGGNRKYEYDERIIKPFDKFYAKLRELSKKGIAIPALAGVFGLGALANKKDDKSVDNIK